MIEIKCDTKERLTLDEMTNLQGKLKTLTKENAAKLKKQIREHGFIVPFFVWRDGEVNYILDGHQRQDVLRQMEADGEEIPERFPVVYVEADDEKDAKKKLLAINSQYGKMTEEGLFNFMEEIDFEFEDLADFEFPTINYGEIFPINEEEEWEGMPEFVQEDDKPFRSIVVHFDNNENVKTFVELLNVKITDKTKYIFFPSKENVSYGKCILGGEEENNGE